MIKQHLLRTETLKYRIGSKQRVRCFYLVDGLRTTLDRYNDLMDSASHIEQPKQASRKEFGGTWYTSETAIGVTCPISQ